MKRNRSFLSLAMIFAGFFISLFLVPIRPVAAAWEITTDTVWKLSDSPIIATDWVAVREGAKLTIEPGVVVKFSAKSIYDKTIVVGGSLVAVGTSDNPIIFTSIKDDTAGGDSNNDGALTTPKRGDWYRLKIQSGTAVMKNVIIRYGGNGGSSVIYNYRGQLEMSNTITTLNGAAIANDEGNLTITNSSIYNNILYVDDVEMALQNSGRTGYIKTVTATNNWFGTADGPCPWQTLVSSTTPPWLIDFTAICGTRPLIDNNVIYTPWLVKEPTMEDEKAIHPVIVIPGIMGSWQGWDGQWEIDPILHTYDDLLAAMRLAGYKDGETLFTFPYQWRQSNVISAQQLKDKIQAVKVACKGDKIDCSKVDLVGHSMGGLVARAYIEGDNYQNDVDQLIFIATPHKGAPKAYLMWEGGEFDNNILANFIGKKIFEIEAELHGYKTSILSDGVYQYVKNEVPSVQQLLPIYDYLKDVNSNILRQYPNNYPVNTFLESLNNVANLSKLNSINLINIIGNSGNLTISSLRLVDSTFNFDDKWTNGIPENYNSIFGDRGLDYGAGDNTVPQESNSGFNGLTDMVVNGADHSFVVAKSQKMVIKVLTGQEPDTEIISTLIDKILMFRIFSPADFVVITPDGQRLGRNIDGEGSLLEVSNGYYSGYSNSSTPEFVIITNPMDGNYQVRLIGTDAGGGYMLSASSFSNMTSSDSNFSGQIMSGSQRNLNFSYVNDGQIVTEIKADITIDSAINDIYKLYNQGELLNERAEQKILQQYKFVQTKDKIFDLTIKLAENALVKLTNNKLKPEISNKLVLLAQTEINKLKLKRSQEIIDGLDKINDLANDYLVKNILKQLGYDIIKTNNDYLKNNWQ